MQNLPEGLQKLVDQQPQEFQRAVSNYIKKNNERKYPQPDIAIRMAILYFSKKVPTSDFTAPIRAIVGLYEEMLNANVDDFGVDIHVLKNSIKQSYLRILQLQEMNSNDIDELYKSYGLVKRHYMILTRLNITSFKVLQAFGVNELRGLDGIGEKCIQNLLASLEIYNEDHPDTPVILK